MRKRIVLCLATIALVFTALPAAFSQDPEEAKRDANYNNAAESEKRRAAH
jgi:hypothetical protein